MKKLRISCLLILTMLFSSCSKIDDAMEDIEGYNNRIHFVLLDNGTNFSMFSTVLQRTYLYRTLLENGPFTVLAPDNKAFIRKGYSNVGSIQNERLSYWAQVAPYHIIKGTWELNKLPFSFNQKITTLNENPIFVTRWIKDQDTILTINGNPLLAANLPASNGLIQAIDGIVEPMVYKNLKEAVEADATLTFLNAAIQRSNSEDLFTSTEPRTLFAPTNAAFQAIGINDIDQIFQMEKSQLKDLLQYTMFRGLRFTYDYHLTTKGTKTEQTMLDGNRIGITLIYNQGVFSTIELLGSGNTSPIKLSKKSINMLTGNGVIHIVDAVLKVNQ